LGPLSHAGDALAAAVGVAGPEGGALVVDLDAELTLPVGETDGRPSTTRVTAAVREGLLDDSVCGDVDVGRERAPLAFFDHPNGQAGGAAALQ
jgi:hypothetical protein